MAQAAQTFDLDKYLSQVYNTTTFQIHNIKVAIWKINKLIINDVEVPFQLLSIEKPQRIRISKADIPDKINSMKVQIIQRSDIFPAAHKLETQDHDLNFAKGHKCKINDTHYNKDGWLSKENKIFVREMTE